MDEGAVISWEHRKKRDEASGLQHAMNLKFQDEAAFYAEYQNDPRDPGRHEAELTPDQIAARTNNLKRSTVPVECSHLTAFIDVQQKALPYAVLAWTERFGGAVVDYGMHPDQRRAYFSLRDVKRTLESIEPNGGLEGAIYTGLTQLTDRILSKEWRREDGAMMRVELCLIDANWGQSTDVVYQFCRQSPHAALVTPSHGRYIGASSHPLSQHKRKPGERVGHNWMIPNVKGKRAIRHVIYDTNYWKSFVHARLAEPMGGQAALSIFGKKPERHRLFSEHLTAEYRVRTSGRGREVDEWKAKPNQPDNHWFDCLVGCAVAASMRGVTMDAHQPAKVTARRKRVSFAEMQRKKRERRRMMG